MKADGAMRIPRLAAAVVYFAGMFCAAIPALFYAGAIASGFPKATYADALIAILLCGGVSLAAAALLAAFAYPAGHHVARTTSGLLALLLGYGVVVALLPTAGRLLWVPEFIYGLFLPFVGIVVVLAVAHRSVRSVRQNGSATWAWGP